ncbi:hypothetical protein DRE_00907 [Drechslerella stenobrocha 248]|uniref:Argonaute linker 1 domain-containing protein n=1 Tax=Drechslerella stenobrocha 248 TaxID=1043628 RepID=W7HY33_9PEZI|nr:hypothetical protein DRE_00907 [Drechslerella stenobrocha 248]
MEAAAKAGGEEDLGLEEEEEEAEGGQEVGESPAPRAENPAPPTTNPDIPPTELGSEDLGAEGAMRAYKLQLSTPQQFAASRPPPAPGHVQRQQRSSGTVQYVLTNYFEFQFSEENKTKILKYTLDVQPPTQNKDVIDAFIVQNFDSNEIPGIVPDYAGHVYIPGSRGALEDEAFQLKNDAGVDIFTFTIPRSSEEVLDLATYYEYIQGRSYPSLGDASGPGDDDSESSVIPNDCASIIQALNAIILRYSRIKHGPAIIHEKGNSMFLAATNDPPDSSIGKLDISGLDFGYGLQILTGFRASVRPGAQKLLANVSKTTNVFYKEAPLLEIVPLACGMSQAMQLNSSLRGTSGCAMFQTTYPYSNLGQF